MLSSICEVYTVYNMHHNDWKPSKYPVCQKLPETLYDILKIYFERAKVSVHLYSLIFDIFHVCRSYLKKNISLDALQKLMNKGY